MQEVLGNKNIEGVFSHYNEITREYRDSIMARVSPKEWFGNSFEKYRSDFHPIVGKTYGIENEQYTYFNVNVVSDVDEMSFEGVSFTFKNENSNWVLSEIVFNQ